MPRRNKSPRSAHAGRGNRKKAGADHRFYTPFHNLDQYLASVKTGPEPNSAGSGPDPERDGEATDDRSLFLAAMEGVTPLQTGGARKLAGRRRRHQLPRFLAQEEQEVLLQLEELVRGEGDFDLFWSDEHVDGAVVGLSPAVLKKLRRGEFSYQAHLDLHGATRLEARPMVQQFVLKKQAQGLRCLLIICGRGLNSKNREPVLKEHLVRWLTRSPLKGLVLAFCCARSWDGGAGAFYVLLRRSKSQTPVLTPAT